MKRILIPLTLLLLAVPACQVLSPEAASPAAVKTTTAAASTTTPTAGALNQPASSGLPDLAVGQYASVRYFGCPWSEGGEIRGNVRNTGDGRSAPFSVEINGGLAGVQALESGLAAYPAVTFEKGPVGSIHILADPDGRIEEIDEGNNTYQIIFTPPPPCTTPPPTPSPTRTPPAPFTFIVPAGSLWNQPEVVIYKGDRVTIRTLSGRWTYSPEISPVDSRGSIDEPICGLVKPGAQCGLPYPLAPTGALLAALPLSEPVPVGAEVTFTAEASGLLNLQMNAAMDETTLAQRSGEIVVEITISRP